MKETVKELKTFITLWSTQSLSQLGSAMTGFALGLWLYEKTGSALQTALLQICSYGPYILMSILAGALSDRWDKKKIMLVCDTLAAGSTMAILLLLKGDLLMPWHMYVLNALNGLMNTVQQPAGDVAMTLITPRKHFQRVSGMRSFSNSFVTILHPVLATTLFAFGGMDLVIGLDLVTFAIAFLVLLFFVKIPKIIRDGEKQETILKLAGEGLLYLKKNPMILTLMFFLAGVNLIASAFDAALPAFVLPRKQGGEAVLGVVTSFAGIATLLGSVMATALPAPKNRIRVIYLTMLFSLSVENVILSLSQTPWIWCLAQVVGWLPVPIMSANLDVIFRSTIPTEMQGRVYSCRNTLQFFTIPIGLFLGGFLIDEVCEPFMRTSSDFWQTLFGSGKGSGAALLIFGLGIAGACFCLGFGRLLGRYRFEER